MPALPSYAVQLNAWFIVGGYWTCRVYQAMPIHWTRHTITMVPRTCWIQVCQQVSRHCVHVLYKLASPFVFDNDQKKQRHFTAHNLLNSFVCACMRVCVKYIFIHNRLCTIKLKRCLLSRVHKIVMNESSSS